MIPAQRLAWLTRGALTLLLLVPGCAAGETPGRARPSLANLDSVEDMRAAFNRAPGTPRLVLLLSPT